MGPPDPGRAPVEVGGGWIRGQAAGLEGSVKRVGEPAIAVAPHPGRPLAELLQAVKGLGGHGAVGEITAEHDRVHSRGFHVAQDRIQRWEVAVDVGQHRDRMTASLLRYCRVCPSQTAHPAGFARS